MAISETNEGRVSLTLQPGENGSCYQYFVSPPSGMKSPQLLNLLVQAKATLTEKHPKDESPLEAKQRVTQELAEIDRRLMALDGPINQYCAREAGLDQEERQIEEENKALDDRRRAVEDDYRIQLERIDHDRTLLQDRRSELKRQRDRLGNDRSAIDVEHLELRERGENLRLELQIAEEELLDQYRQLAIELAEKLGLDPNVAMNSLFPGKKEP